MYQSKSILGLITARGGSRGIPKKNLAQLGGRPLIAWTVEAGRRSRYLDKLILSSEDPAIIEAARALGCEVPFIRPEALALDETGSVDVVLHALSCLATSFDYVLLLQPTSPFRHAGHVDEMIEECVGSNRPAMVSVCRSRKHPAFMYELVDGLLRPFLSLPGVNRRQDMPAAYEHNGAMYLTTVEYIKEKRSYNGDDVAGYVMGEVASVDIDAPLDLEYAEFLIASGKVK